MLYIKAFTAHKKNSSCARLFWAVYTMHKLFIPGGNNFLVIDAGYDLSNWCNYMYYTYYESFLSLLLSANSRKRFSIVFRIIIGTSFASK
ncbi:hypothetical protein CLV24_14217 [Pontibacter ummariensis]|uniref:Uncharacterized protein n=1 Tax=Pontibacter ummariensis TaxID=1610492 RepID=A0A239LJX0_9BACT|nr:hypothetical protein CLV24_14217 [Pontibacter ummariensis]SNT29949.1 hypothetical protein SAMN06296052_14217 [Pontibacter ummariensis]